MRTAKGFSLIELLIVVAIILIIAAIAIPNLLQARLAANESSAAGSLHAMQSAEITYYNTYPSVGYSTGLTQLGGASPCTPSSTTACLLDSYLATSIPGSTGKSGYYFAATGVVTGGASNFTAYIVGAAPITVNKTGNRDFCSTNDGVLRSKMAAAGDTPVNDIPTCIAFPVAQ
jgi:prepilin-type N-terminal cleavage/methylation domain-containing protein